MYYRHLNKEGTLSVLWVDLLSGKNAICTIQIYMITTFQGFYSLQLIGSRRVFLDVLFWCLLRYLF